MTLLYLHQHAPTPPPPQAPPPPVPPHRAVLPLHNVPLHHHRPRLQLIDDLKKKWDEVNVQYQQGSVLSLASLDTIGKVKRKEMYEAQLAQMEKDIEKLSKKNIYVRVDEQY